MPSRDKRLKAIPLRGGGFKRQSTSSKHTIARLGGVGQIEVDKASLSGPTTRTFAIQMPGNGPKPAGYDDIWTTCTNCGEIGRSMKVDPGTKLCRSAGACEKRKQEALGVSPQVSGKTIHDEMKRAQADSLSPATRDRIVAMLQSGETHATIAKAVGVSTYQIVKVADAAGIKRGPGGRPIAPAHTDSSALTEQEETHKYRILKMIVDDGPFHYESEITSRIQARPDMKIDGHGLSHVLHALLKQGKISARTGHGNEGTRLQRIEATVEGRRLIRMTEAERGRQNEKPAPAHDYPHPGLLCSVNGCPGRVPEPDTATEVEPVILRDPDGDGVSVALPGFIVPPGGIHPDEAADNGPVTTERYPVIVALLAREGQIRKAADALEAADLDDLALAALSKIDDLSPLEREIIAFVKEERMWTNR